MLAFEVARARALLADGAPLIAQLQGRPKLAVAAFAAGGRAALDAIERARYDVLAGPPRAGRARRAAALVATLRASRRRTCAGRSAGRARAGAWAREHGVEIAGAYRHCEAVTRAQAANFFYGIRLLPGDRRRAMCAVYAFARRVDDIGDGTLEREEKLRRLDGEARALAAIARRRRRRRAIAVMVALADAQRRFPLPLDALAS